MSGSIQVTPGGDKYRYLARLDSAGQWIDSSTGSPGTYTSLRYLSNGARLTTSVLSGGAPSSRICLLGSSWCGTTLPSGALNSAGSGADQLPSGVILQACSELTPRFNGLRLLDAATGALLERLEIVLAQGQTVSLRGPKVDAVGTVRGMASLDAQTHGLVRLAPHGTHRARVLSRQREFDGHPSDPRGHGPPQNARATTLSSPSKACRLAKQPCSWEVAAPGSPPIRAGRKEHSVSVPA